MRRLSKRALLPGIGLAIGLLIWIVAAARANAPHIQGRALSVWVELAGLSERDKRMCFGQGLPPDVAMAPMVLRQQRAETEAILLQQLAARDPIWADGYHRLTMNGPGFLQSILPYRQSAVGKWKSALTAISRLGPLTPRLEEAVIQAAKRPDRSIRLRAAQILAFKGSGSPDAVRAFEALRRDPAIGGAFEGSYLSLDHVIQWCFGPDFLPQNLQETIQVLNAPFEVARYEAVRALKKSAAEPSRIVPPLIQALNDSHEIVSVSAAKALGQIGPVATNALPALRGLLASPRPAIREAAHEAINKIEASACLLVHGWR